MGVAHVQTPSMIAATYIQGNFGLKWLCLRAGEGERCTLR